MVNYIKAFFITENNKLPDTILLYREGLNEKQANKVLKDEIASFERAFERVRSKVKKTKWKPNFIYILVNQRTGTRIYTMDNRKHFSNPLPGTIVGENLSRNNGYEFLMASAATTQGTCNMIQYKVAYDSSKQ